MISPNKSLRRLLAGRVGDAGEEGEEEEEEEVEEDAERCRLRLPGVGGARKLGEAGGWLTGYCVAGVVEVGDGGVSVRVMVGRVRERRGMVG